MVPRNRGHTHKSRKCTPFFGETNPDFLAHEFYDPLSTRYRACFFGSCVLASPDICSKKYLFIRMWAQMPGENENKNTLGRRADRGSPNICVRKKSRNRLPRTAWTLGFFAVNVRVVRRCPVVLRFSIGSAFRRQIWLLIIWAYGVSSSNVLCKNKYRHALGVLRSGLFRKKKWKTK